MATRRPEVGDLKSQYPMTDRPRRPAQKGRLAAWLLQASVPARKCWHMLRRDWAGWWAAMSGPRPGRRRLLSFAFRRGPLRRRIHLQLKPDAGAVLLVDAQDAVHLNPTAAFVARLVLQGVPPARIVRLLRRRYPRTDGAQVEADAREVFHLIDHLLTTTTACPTCAVAEGRRAELFSLAPGAPLKADVCLTYGCNNSCGHCYNPPERRAMEPLDLRAWRRVLKILARVGIPQVIFTGGEPTLVAHLPELVRSAARLGLVTGLNTNGRRLAEPRFAERLAQAGLSHVQVTLLAPRAELHDRLSGARSFDETTCGIRRALAAGLHTITNTTLTRLNAPAAEELVDFLYALGVRIFAANSMIHSGSGRNHPHALAEEELGPLLANLRDRAAERGMRFLWYTPTAYCRFSPLELELGPRRCNAAEYSICIEPNGDVLPCQSYYQPAGNLLRDHWEKIWHSPLFRSFRDRVADPAGCGLPEECWRCADLNVCAGGCRLQRERGLVPLATLQAGQPSQKAEVRQEAAVDHRAGSIPVPVPALAGHKPAAGGAIIREENLR